MIDQRHDHELRDFFAGVFDGACGLRSAMGGQLDALRNGTVESGPRSLDCMPVKPALRIADRVGEVSEAMMDAARKSRRIEATLRTMEREHVQTLAAHYTPRGPLEPDREVRLVLGADFARVAALVSSEERDQKRDGKREWASAEHRARAALEVAQEAYQAAADAMVEIERDGRRARFAAGLR